MASECKILVEGLDLDRVIELCTESLTTSNVGVAVSQVTVVPGESRLPQLGDGLKATAMSVGQASTKIIEVYPDCWEPDPSLLEKMSAGTGVRVFVAVYQSTAVSGLFECWEAGRKRRSIGFVEGEIDISEGEPFDFESERFGDEIEFFGEDDLDWMLQKLGVKNQVLGGYPEELVCLSVPDSERMVKRAAERSSMWGCCLILVLVIGLPFLLVAVFAPKFGVWAIKGFSWVATIWMMVGLFSALFQFMERKGTFRERMRLALAAIGLNLLFWPWMLLGNIESFRFRRSITKGKRPS